MDINVFKKNSAVILESADLQINYLLQAGDSWVVVQSGLIRFYRGSIDLFNYAFDYTEVLDELGAAQANLSDTINYLTLQLNF